MILNPTRPRPRSRRAEGSGHGLGSYCGLFAAELPLPDKKIASVNIAIAVSIALEVRDIARGVEAGFPYEQIGRVHVAVFIEVACCDDGSYLREPLRERRKVNCVCRRQAADKHTGGDGHRRLWGERRHIMALHKIGRLVVDDERRLEIAACIFAKVIRDKSESPVAAEIEAGQGQSVIGEGGARGERLHAISEHQIDRVDAGHRQLTIRGEQQARVGEVVQKRNGGDLR